MENQQLRVKGRVVTQYETTITSYQKQLTVITQQLETVTTKYQLVEREKQETQAKLSGYQSGIKDETAKYQGKINQY